MPVSTRVLSHLRVLTAFFVTALFALCVASSTSSLRAQSSIVINEFCYDNEGVDDQEFVELYNRGLAAVEISGWQLVAEDASGESSRVRIPARTILAAGAFYVIGSPLVPGVDLVAGTRDLWPNAQHALSIVDAAARRVDVVNYETWRSSWRLGASPGDDVWPEFESRDSQPTSLQRVRDGVGGARRFEIRLRTPGSRNRLPPPSLRLNFDQIPIGAPLPNWMGTFARPRVIDPKRADAHNPAELAPSPQGGKAAVFWDRRGGGNTCMPVMGAVGENIVLETYVWVDLTPLKFPDRAMWSIGVCGGSGSFYDFANVSGSQPQFVKNGNTGVSWTYESHQGGATLYLFEHGDGGWGASARSASRQLAKIPLTRALHHGWQRLRREVRGRELEACFGGSWGCADGTRVRAQLRDAPIGGAYFSFRERIADPAAWRPLICDHLRIAPSDARADYFGRAQPTTHGLPRLRVAQSALPGRADFRILADGLTPRSAHVLLFGLGRLPNPVDLRAFGARPQTFVYVDAITWTPSVADLTGSSAIPFPLPCRPELAGARLEYQLVDFDARLNLAFPVGTSRVLRLTVGR